MMAKRPSNDGASWSAGELRTLKQLVQQKAMRAGISFRAAKRSGARKKK